MVDAAQSTMREYAQLERFAGDVSKVLEQALANAGVAAEVMD